MEQAHKAKITEAITLCESRMSSFLKHLEQVMGKPNSTKLAQHILAETYFAGGVFRSVIAGEQPNDIDVWFRSQDAMLEFKHMVYCSKKEIFFEVTNNESFNWKSGNNKGPQLSFITKNYGQPNLLIEKFDFTFNQHYYSMNEFKLHIDTDTFSKKGTVNLDCNDAQGALLRAFRFMNEGWSIDERSLLDLVKRTSAKPELVEMANSSGQNKPATGLHLTGTAYSEADYFGTAREASSLTVDVETLGLVYGTTTPVGNRIFLNQTLRNQMAAQQIPTLQPGAAIARPDPTGQRLTVRGQEAAPNGGRQVIDDRF